MSARRPSAAPQSFSSVIFSYEYLGVQLCLETYNHLLNDSNQLSDILTDDDTSIKLLSDFEAYTKRIAQFFTIVKDHSANAARQHQSTMAERILRKKIVEQLLLPLFGDDFKTFHSKPAFMDLIVSMIQLNVSFYPGALKPLTERLGAKSELLGLLISGEGSSSVMKDWIATFRSNITNLKIFESWTSTFITLCKNCESNHGMSQEIQKWHKLGELKERLKTAQGQLRNNTESNRSFLSLPFNMMRKLGDGDKKSASGRVTQAPTTNINLSTTDHILLSAFNIAPPSSERGLILALEKLETDETLSIMRNLVDTFPCRLCNDPRENHTSNDNSYLHAEGDQSHKFSELYGRKLGNWRVHLSEQALKDLNDASYEGNFEHIKKKLIELASGDWGKRKSLVDTAGSSNQRQSAQGTLHEAFYGSNGRILWQIDVEFDEDTNNVTQVVKVWKIGDDKEIKRAIKSVLYVQKNYSKSRMKACKEILIDKHSGRNLPKVFFDTSVLKLEQKASVGLEEFDSEDEKLFESSLLSNKFYSLTEIVISNLLSKNVNLELPLVISEEELGVIKSFKTSTLVLGRSGTGKTTCLVYKLLSRYLTGVEIQQRKPHRQVLLTRSPVLAHKLRGQMKRLIDFQRENVTDKIEEDVWAGIDSYDKEVTDTITSLKDENFPLVCTFDYFLKLLENTIRYADRKDFSFGKRPIPNGKNGDHQTPGFNEYGRRERIKYHSQKSHKVDYGVFRDDYWCTFPYHLTRKFPVASVFMEIMGIIKGSASPETKFKPLSKEAYFDTSYKLAPSFTGSGERECIYNIYERYEKRKHELQALDDIDRVIAVFRAISENKDLKKKVEQALDEIYVDEVQDQRLLEIELLVNIVKDPRGIHFAGDTAQCVSKDSTFRFEDVKALLFRNFSRLSTVAHAPELARPELIKLDKNFRAHQGILSFASFVMELLWTEFPTMVDKLPPEIGQYRGPKPTILVNFGPFFTNILKSVELRPRWFNLSAEQVIIVREDKEKETLIDDIGPNRKILILTILESKGMEFDEVFLVDFFTTSKCHASFRTLAKQGNIDGLKHVALCSELKQLYVAITRPRNRLWLLESDPLSVNSIVNLLAKEPNEPIIDVEYTHTDEKIKRIMKQMCCGKTSSPREWSKRGREFLHRQDYENAKFCFENADDARGIDMTQAFIEEQRGRNHRALHNEKDFIKCFRVAVELFHKSDLPLKEATCFEALGEFKTAAVIFSDHHEYEKAASLFELAECYKKASDNYILAGNYDEGAGALRRGGLFEKLVRYLNKHRDSIDPNTQSHYSRLCNLLLKQGKISSDLETITVEALGSDSEQETFYHDYEMTDKLKDFYTAKKRYTELFDLVVKNEEIENAWSLVEEYNLYRQIPQNDVTEVFNYAQFKSLSQGLSSEPNTVLKWNEKWYPRKIPQILEMMRPWQELSRVLNDCQDRVIDYESVCFEESWMKGLFSIIVTIKATYFIDAANKMSKLPIESINEMTEMVKLLSTEGKIAPSLLLFLGIFPVSKKTETYRLLDWSPLDSGPDPPAKNLDAPAIVDKVRKWALDNLHPAITQIHKKALELYKRQYPERCCFYLATSICLGTCKYLHLPITQEGFANSIKDLLRASSIYNTFMLLYYRYARQPDILDSEFAKSFRGNHRRWLESITAQITLFSSFEHDAGILMKTHHDISCESSGFFGVLGGLENLLFHRIRHDWNNKHSISYLLEQLQHAETLGVADRFMKCLSNAFWDTPRYPSKTHARNTLREIRNLRYEKVPGTPETHRQYDTVLWMLEQFSIEEFPSFHAVISFYEKLATFLIYMSRPSEFLIPNSWVQMYLVQMPGLFTEEVQVGQSRMSSFQVQQMKLRENSDLVSQHWYQQSLLRAVESFCNMIHYILNQDGAVTTMSAGSVKPKPSSWQYLARRQIDFLAVTMSNLMAMLPQTMDVTRVWYTVQMTVTLLSANEGNWGRLPPQMLAINLFESFERYYNKKDFLLIVTQGGRNSRSFPGLHLRGVPPTSIDSIWSSRLQKTTVSVPASDAESQLNIEYSEKEKWAAGIIQNFCRTRYPKVRQRREFLASPTGKVHVFIQKLREKILKRNLSPKERLERVVLLVRDGTELCERVKDLEDRFREIRKISKEELTNEALTTDQLEDLQDLWEELPKIRQKVRQEVKMYTEKNEEWLDWSPKDLETNYADTNGFLDAVEAELNQRTKELEGIRMMKELEENRRMKELEETRRMKELEEIRRMEELEETRRIEKLEETRGMEELEDTWRGNQMEIFWRYG